MKKLLLLAGFVFTLTGVANAQEMSDNAIGLRFGANDGLGTEVSYQRSLSDANRLEVDLGWRSSNHTDIIKLTGLYQWVMPLQDNFNWFAGVGGGVLNWSFDTNLPGVDNSGTEVFAAGNAGIEYHFDFPLMLALDIRPELGFGDYNDGIDVDLGFSARYTF